MNPPVYGTHVEATKEAVKRKDQSKPEVGICVLSYLPYNSYTEQVKQKEICTVEYKLEIVCITIAISERFLFCYTISVILFKRRTRMTSRRFYFFVKT